MRIIIIVISLIILVTETFAQNHRDSIDVYQYNITIDVSDFTEFVIEANTAIIFQTTGNELHKVAFDLYAYSIDSIIFNNEKIDVFEYNDTVISFLPTVPIQAGQKDTCQVFYHGVPSTEPGYGWGGVHHGTSMIFNMGVAIQDVPHGFGRGWFPCIDNFTDRAFYNINVITQQNHRAIASGVLDDEIAYGTDKKMWKWVLNQTSPTYLVSFAVGNFTLNSMDYSGESTNFPIEIYALQGDSADAAATFADVPEMISLYEDLFGPYHWDKAGYTVVNFNSGAMEHLTNIAYPNYALSTNVSDQTLVAHELSHHWFGNLVTCNRAEDMWLNEGWASYCEALYMEHFYGEESYYSYVTINQRDVVSSAHDADGGYWALNEIPLDLTYSTTVYDKGSMIVHNLRHYMGDDLFFPAVKHYLSELAENTASSEDLRDKLMESSGLDLTGFFNTWVFNGGFPQYTVDSVINNGDEVVVGVSQQGVGREHIGDQNKVHISFIDDDWSVVSDWLTFDGESGSASFSPGFEPVMTILDMYNKTADAVFDHYKILNSITNYSPTGTNVTIYPQVLTDSVFIHTAQMWKGPKDAGVSANGLEPIDLPYWRISFDVVGEFSAKTKFKYNTIGQDHLNLTDEDSLVLIYRPDSRTPWRIPQHAVYGNLGSGSFMLAYLKPGDYAVAKWQGAVNVGELPNRKINVWPNPFINGCYFELPTYKDIEIRVYNTNGQVVDNVMYASPTKQQYYDASSLNSGVYFYEIIHDNKSFSSGRIIKM
jgi:hypothetical protein